MLRQTSMVHDVEISHEDTVHKASYFVEHGVIHARIGERVMLSPVNGGDPDRTVRSMLLGQILQNTRKARQASHWRRTGAQ